MNRSVGLVLATLAFAPRLSAQQQLVFIENSRGGDLSIIDDATQQVVGTIPIGLSPDDIVSSPDGKTLYVTRIIRREPGRPAAPGDVLGEVVAVDPAKRVVLWRAPVSGTPNHLMASPDGKYVYVTIVSTTHVDVVDIGKKAVVDTISVGTGPHDIEISEDGKRGYVGLIRGTAVTEFDAATRKPVRSFEMGQNVRPIAVTHDEKTMFVQVSWFYGFKVVDLASGKVTRSIDMPIPEGQHRPDSLPNTTNHGLRIADGGKVLISNGSMWDVVGFYSLPDLALLGTVPVGDDPNWITLSPDGKHAYVSNRGSDDVSIIDIATRKELARVKAGKYPQRMASVRVGGK